MITTQDFIEKKTLGHAEVIFIFFFLTILSNIFIWNKYLQLFMPGQYSRCMAGLISLKKSSALVQSYYH